MKFRLYSCNKNKNRNRKTSSYTVNKSRYTEKQNSSFNKACGEAALIPFKSVKMFGDSHILKLTARVHVTGVCKHGAYHQTTMRDHCYVSMAGPLTHASQES